ncbi:MAG TPA: putative baseplate assembly protein, partial [bacterium]|nr:putative baseplate assembly protein [bacterium]
PATMEISFRFSETASDGSELGVIWEYYDGDRWATITEMKYERTTGQFDSNDDTELFTRNGTMTLVKRHTAEIAETEVNSIKNRWLRCRLTRSLPGQASLQLPEINTIAISVSPVEKFSPDLAFNNDIPLNLEEIQIAMEAIEGLKIVFDQLPTKGDTDIYLSVTEDVTERNLLVGDFLKLDNKYDGVEIRTITAINGTKVTLNEALQFDYDSTATVEIYTALRPPLESGTLQEVSVESIEGYEISDSSTVTLFHRGKKETAELVERTGTESLQLKRTEYDPDVFYIAGDTLKITPKIKPFGELPQQFDTFYIASDEAFSKKGADIDLFFDYELNAGSDEQQGSDTDAQNGGDQLKINPVLSWEYWNGTSWRGLRVVDTTDRFMKKSTQTEKISFTCPKDIEKVEVNGEEKFWVRSRLIDGDYGREIVIEPKNSGTEVNIQKGIIHFPIINDVKIYYQNIQETPQNCITYNSLNYNDRSKECTDENKVFSPFVMESERYPGFYMGFDRALTGGPLRILFEVVEQFLTLDQQVRISWFYWNGSQWVQVNAVDETEQLTRIGLLEFIGSRDFQSKTLFGSNLYWLKGSVVEGTHPQPVQIKSIYPNTAYALQASVAENEIAGSGNGTAGQEFTLQHPMVIDQEVRVREPLLSDEERAEVQAEHGEDAVIEKRNQKGDLIENRVLWTEVEDFDSSEANSRHYEIDKRDGTIRFGDGVHGMVPPVGKDNIIVTYRYGGGVKGNVPKDSISGFKSAVPFVKSVTNPLAADGGAEAEELENVLVRGPLRLKNRTRAVTSEDFEALTKSISRKVVRTECLPNVDETRNITPGWVTVIIVPEADDPRPEPTILLTKVVEDGLQNLCSASLAAPDHIHVTGPDYSQIQVRVTLIPTSMDLAATVDEEARSMLTEYFHPLTGGVAGTGWDFGASICLSELFALLEKIDGVDYVGSLDLLVNGKVQKSDVMLDQFSLPYSGEHEIKISLGGTATSTGRQTPKTECLKPEDLTACDRNNGT